jgi:hypothetical protein
VEKKKMIMAAVAGVVLLVAVVLIVRALSSGAGESGQPGVGERIEFNDEAPEAGSVPQP